MQGRRNSSLRRRMLDDDLRRLSQKDIKSRPIVSINFCLIIRSAAKEELRDEVDEGPQQ